MLFDAASARHAVLSLLEGWSEPIRGLVRDSDCPLVPRRISVLAACLATTADTEAALADYEAELFPRSAEAAAESARNLDVIFSDRSPQTLVELFESFRHD
ncbi:hypothetical protein [Herbiconiux sp.]|uniref:hypothetical protein n=1 Tax=Herbiconiux sp. TaxID=1871186 RepID=UPI0025C19F55|nr:hypothetical protein [Herbiconiux sp.]